MLRHTYCRIVFLMVLATTALCGTLAAQEAMGTEMPPDGWSANSNYVVEPSTTTLPSLTVNSSSSSGELAEVTVTGSARNTTNSYVSSAFQMLVSVSTAAQTMTVSGPELPGVTVTGYKNVNNVVVLQFQNNISPPPAYSSIVYTAATKYYVNNPTIRDPDCPQVQAAAQTATALYNNSKIKDSIQGKMPGLATATSESGFYTYDSLSWDAGTHAFAHISYLSDQLFPGSSSNVSGTSRDTIYQNDSGDYTARLKSLAWTHNHTTGHYPAPSAQDIVNASVNHGMTYYIPAFDGSTYALHISTQEYADSFYAKQAGNIGADNNFKKGSQIYKDLKLATDYYNNELINENVLSGAALTNRAYELALSAVLELYYSGVSLMKLDPADGQFKPIGQKAERTSDKKVNNGIKYSTKGC